jgi:RHS repeat-associated protein
MGAGPLTSPVESTTYDNLGRPLTQTDPLGNVTTYAYADSTRTVTTTLPDPDGGGSLSSPVLVQVLDARGLVASTTDPLGAVTTYEYDGAGRLKKVTAPDPDGAGSLTSPITQYQYDGVGNLRFTTDPLGHVTEHEYDRASRLIETTLPDPDGAGSLSSPVTTYAYSPAGYLASTTDPLSRVTSYEYDHLGRLKKTIAPDPDGGGPLPAPQTQYAYDGAGRRTSVTDPLGNVTSYAYNFYDQLTTLTQPDPDGAGSLTSPVTTYTYNAASELLTLTDPVNNTTTWTYDALGRVSTETNQLSKTRTFKYDAASNLTEKVDRLGRKTEYVYDNLHRNTSEKWYDGSTLVRTLSFSYDASTRLVSASDPSATYSYGYDALNRVTNEGQTLAGLTPVVQYASTFNADSQRATLQSVIGGTNDFKNSYTYDNLHRLTRLQQEDVSGGNVVADKRFDFTYSAASQFDKLTRYADLAGSEFVANTFHSYDGMGRLTKLLHTEDNTAPSSGWGTEPLAGYLYAYDAASRFTSIDSYADGLTTYSHDNTDQLTGADHTGQADETYTYDKNGNRTMSGYSTGTNNRLTSDGTFNYTYDDEGNRLTKTKISNSEKEEYAWDHRNRLITITFKNGSGTVTKTVNQSYDIYNRWVRRAVDPDGPGSAAAVDTFFSHLDGQIHLEFDGTTAADLAHRYSWGSVVDQILADETVTNLSSAGTVLWPFADHLGTPRDLVTYNATTGDATLANHRRYDSYGILISETNTGIDLLFGFTGRPFDESTGLNNHWNRWYAFGVWLSEDPITFSGNDSSLVRYVSNSPLSFVDINGLWQERVNQSPPIREGNRDNGYDGTGEFRPNDIYSRMKEIYGWGNDDWNSMQRGCVGLSLARLGRPTPIRPKPGNPEFPHLIPGTLIFHKREDAQKKLDELNAEGQLVVPKKYYMLVAIQTNTALRPYDGDPDKLPEGQISPAQIRFTNAEYNFATFHPCGFWEYMNHSIGPEHKTPATVIHSEKLPDYEFTFYAVIEILTRMTE